MASFTDIIPQFNPYVQQLPVEAMVQVGMEKQKRYDEGIQKIQTQIDEIGGMDIYKPIHRMYLQSKLNELGNNLKGVAAGDFSNFQLVNSVGGMISQVIKDPVVKNAYESTQLLRKQQGYMETAKRNGKSSPENEWWFSNEIDSWQNDPDLMKKFTGEYIEYRDVDKKLRDVASKIKEMEKSVDIPYQRNADGSYRLDANGNPMVDDAMLRIKVKGTPAEKILNNFYSSLDENDKRQLMITGNYHYRGASKSTFQNDIIDTYDSQKRELSNQISKWAVELRTNDNLTSAQRAAMEANINSSIEKMKGGYFEKEATKKIDEIDKVTDLQDFKYRLYTQKYLTGLAQDLSNQSYTEEILSNPYAQMNMEKKKLEFQVNRARQEHNEFLMNYGLSAARLNMEREKWQYELSEKQAAKQALQPIVDYGGLGTGAKMPTLADIDDSLASTKTNIDGLNAKFGKLLFPKLEGTAQQSALDDLVNKYITNPTAITDNNQRDYVEQMRALQIKQTQQNGIYANTVEVGKKYDEDLNKVFSKYLGGKLNNGANYTAQELYQVRAALDKFINVEKISPKSERVPKISVNITELLQSLPTRLRPLGQALAEGFQGNATGNNLATYSQATKLVKTLRPTVVDDIVAKKMKAQSDYLAAHMPEVQTTFGTLNMDDKGTNFRVENLIGNATRTYDEMGASDQENLKDFNPATISSWRSGEGAKELRYVIEKGYDGSGKLIIYKGTDKQIIPMSARDVQDYFPNVAKKSFMTDVKYQILSSPGKTTNAVAVGDPVNASISGFQIPSLAMSGYAAITRVDVEGAPDNDGGENDRFQVRMYVNDKGVWKDAILNQQGYVSAAGVEEIMSAVGPVTVQEVLRKK